MQKNNILIIITDQLTWKAIPAYGNTDCKTPNIDRIIKRGIRFDNGYTACPLCQPSRAAFWTGRFPHQTKILSNGRKHPVPELDQNITTLGEMFRANGYDTVHFGKQHDAGSLRGFACEPQNTLSVTGTDAWPVNNDTFQDRYTTAKAIEYLAEKEAGHAPFLMVVDLNNPHNICGWVGANKNEHVDVPIDRALPELPDNFAFEDITNRPLPVQYICCSHNRQAQAAGWHETNYRHYLAAYHHYIEMVDAEIGLVLDALEKRPDGQDTLIVFMADHGDGMAAHGLVTKQVSFYDETTRIPFAFCGPGVSETGQAHAALVSLLDLVPTLCDYAQIKMPGSLWGISLLPALRGEPSFAGHAYIACEWHTEWGFTIEPGRMIRSQRYKYTHYLEGAGEELFDLQDDPGEKINRASDKAYQAILEQHRAILKKHVALTDDDYDTLTPVCDPRWRSHKTGYQHHVGIAAPMDAGSV